jgi:hypothetical protein
MPLGMMLLALKCEKLVDRSNRGGVVASDANLPTPRPIDSLVADRGATLGHDSGPRDGLRVHLERFRKIARAERALDVAHVRANRRDGGGVARVVAIQDDATAVGEILKDVCGRVLIDAHDVPAARLHRRKVSIRAPARRAYERDGEADDSDR